MKDIDDEEAAPTVEAPPQRISEDFRPRETGKLPEVPEQSDLLRLPQSATVNAAGERKNGISTSLKNLGLVQVTKEWLDEFRALGLQIEPSAMIRDSRAGQMITQQAGLKALGMVAAQMDKAGKKRKVELAQVLGFLIGKLNATNKEMASCGRKDTPQSASATPAARGVNTFKPLQVVINLPSKPEEKPVVEVKD